MYLRRTVIDSLASVARQELSRLFLVAIPFCAFAKAGLLGNFDANLALYPFLLLVPVIAVSGDWRVIAQKGRGQAILRIAGLFLLLCAILSVINGLRWQAAGLSDYGFDPARRGMVSAIVPLFLFTLLVVVAVMPLTQQQIARAMSAGFVLAVVYTLLQIGTLAGGGAVHAMLWPMVEGARDHGGVPSVLRFGRLTGPTMEAAELAKLCLLFFAPWFAIPPEGPPRLVPLSTAILLAVASLSLTGFVLAAVFGVLLLWPGRHYRNIRLGVLAGAVIACIALALWGGAVLGRLTDLSADPSAIIRTAYNRVALGLIAEHPLSGIGWSSELFFFPARIMHLSYLWEVGQDVATGNALTAKSLLLRLAMYGGAGFLIAAIAVTALLVRKGQGRELRRLRLVFILFAIGGAIDGGMITSFYLWAAPALAIGSVIARGQG